LMRPERWESQRTRGERQTPEVAQRSTGSWSRDWKSASRRNSSRRS
jgi:hypothetical protein